MRLEVVELMGTLGSLGALDPDTARDRDLVLAALQKVSALPPTIRDAILAEIGPIPTLNGFGDLGDLGGLLKNLGKKLKKAVMKAAPLLEAAGAIGVPGASLLAKAANKAAARQGLSVKTATVPLNPELPMTTTAAAPGPGGAPVPPPPTTGPGGLPKWAIPAGIAVLAVVALLVLKKK